jgi:hypothetical protein
MTNTNGCQLGINVPRQWPASFSLLEDNEVKAIAKILAKWTLTKFSHKLLQDYLSSTHASEIKLKRVKKRCFTSHRGG